LYGECLSDMSTVQPENAQVYGPFSARVHHPHHDAVQDVVGYRILGNDPLSWSLTKRSSPLTRTIFFATMALPDFFVRILCVEPGSIARLGPWFE
jgi:hypothetical protein